ncbi:Asp23/Gls24 family envelope stress response protein [Paenibacillus sp. HW567]|uniref:Asp23/Gls24 family envelope stress response protein n=1 Tax=Paenibacillus sp. HW567 TaxID=1034769 RepID=UPI000382306F|nr:Asp23/Gls24 family envelope stress response protein [Paenibacillus sp. HW567]
MLIQNMLGSITISKEAVTNIIGKAAAGTGGIASMSTGMVEEITRKLSGTALQSGIELSATESGLDINLRIVVQYGVRMNEVCKELQMNVREDVEKLAGLSARSVNVKVEKCIV